MWLCHFISLPQVHRQHHPHHHHSLQTIYIYVRGCWKWTFLWGWKCVSLLIYLIYLLTMLFSKVYAQLNTIKPLQRKIYILIEIHCVIFPRRKRVRRNESVMFKNKKLLLLTYILSHLTIFSVLIILIYKSYEPCIKNLFENYTSM